ncbi:sigma-70 family RNA polymerase sigma factor [Thalassotalea fusca]
MQNEQVTYTDHIGQIDRVWRDFHRQLYAFILKRVNCPDTAQDILQEVFIKVQTKLPQLKEPNKLTAWLYQLCRSTIIDHIRKQPNLTINDSTVSEADIALMQSSNAKELAEISRCMAILIQELPEEQKNLLLDTELNGMRQQLAADKYQLSLSATKSRIARGRQALKVKLRQCCTFEFTDSGVNHECKNQCGCQHSVV